MSYNSIDTDYGIGVILSRFNSNYIEHVVQQSLARRFNPFGEPMPNIVDVLHRNFDSVKAESPDYIEKVNDVELQTYIEIIETVCNFYNLEFDADALITTNGFQTIVGSYARIIYEIFVSQFSIYFNNFLVSYIVRNSDGIYEYLVNDPNTKKVKDAGSGSAMRTFIDPKYALIHANLNQVIINISAYDITLNDLLTYFVGPEEASNLAMYITDKGDIFKNYYASLILSPDTMSGVLTNVKLSLQHQTMTGIDVEVK
jgi:hypothetical protein